MQDAMDMSTTFCGPHQAHQLECHDCNTLRRQSWPAHSLLHTSTRCNGHDRPMHKAHTNTLCPHQQHLYLGVDRYRMEAGRCLAV